MDTSLANAALRPPVLDGTNYNIWKVKIRFYIKSIDERAWQRVINGWTPPKRVDEDGDNLIKPESDWTTEEVQVSNYNSKALNAIFSSVDMNMFSLITNCTSAKDAWKILQRHCEDSESVRRTKLRMITSRFENLRMEETETIIDYDRRLREIANEAFSLGDPISNERIRDKKKDAQPSKFPSLPPLERPQRFPAKQQFQPRNEGNGQSNARKYDSVQCRECQGFSHYANECANRLRKNKGYNVSLSDEESDLEEKYTDEDNQTSLTALLTENHWLEVNPSGVALGVATPGRNIYKKSVCLKSTTSENSSGDDESEADDEEMTFESVQKLYEELFEDWTKRNKLNSTLEKLKHSHHLKLHLQPKALYQKDNILYMSLREENEGHWYFDSGSSRHMTGSREHLIDYVEQNCGTRSSDNCYQISEELSCKNVQITELDLWHQKLGHANFKTLKNLSKYDAVRAPKIPQQNGIAERKNKTLQEMTRVMLTSKNISKRFWAEDLNTACHISNKVYLRSGSTMTSYEIIMGKKPNLKYFYVFGCVCYTLNDRDQLAKFDSKSDKRLFLGYATYSRAYRMFNLRTRTIMESINVVFDDCAYLKKKTTEDDVDDLLDNPIPQEDADVALDVATFYTTRDFEVTEAEDGANSEDDTVDDGLNIPTKIQKNHPSSQIIGSVQGEVQTRKKEKVDYRMMVGLVCMSTMYSHVRFSCLYLKLNQKMLWKP
ncbi:uncharacterized protein LOC142549942 [Primulina tabacum]|uniref:uncharacterized protein LOC142549942 n=1 Tax=Primulina tabacum TaxID=48773 RepID=UPI003F59FBDE